MTKRIIRSLSILILLQMCIFICAVSVDALTQSNTNEPNAQDDYVLTEKPVISHSIGDRHNCSEYDATDSLVFLHIQNGWRVWMRTHTREITSLQLV